MNAMSALYRDTQDVFSLLDTSTGEVWLACPICGDRCSHIHYVGTLAQGGISGYSGTKVIGTNYGEERGAVSICIACEPHGHRWQLVVQQHEGNNSLQFIMGWPPLVEGAEHLADQYAADARRAFRNLPKGMTRKQLEEYLERPAPEKGKESGGNER